MENYVRKLLFTKFFKINFSLQFIEELFLLITLKGTFKGSLTNLVYANLFCNVILYNKSLKNSGIIFDCKASPETLEIISNTEFVTNYKDLANAMFPDFKKSSFSRIKPHTIEKRVRNLLHFLSDNNLITLSESYGEIRFRLSLSLLSVYLKSSSDFFEISGDLFDFIERLDSSSSLLTILFIYKINRNKIFQQLKKYRNALKENFLNSLIIDFISPNGTLYSKELYKKFCEFIKFFKIRISNLCAFCTRGLKKLSNFSNSLARHLFDALKQEYSEKGKAYLNKIKVSVFNNGKNSAPATKHHNFSPDPDSHNIPSMEEQQKIIEAFTACFARN